MTVKLFFDRKPVMTFLGRESAEEYKAQHSAAMQKRMEIRETPNKNGAQK
jgi:hypothetical protein